MLINVLISTHTYTLIESNCKILLHQCGLANKLTTGTQGWSARCSAAIDISTSKTLIN